MTPMRTPLPPPAPSAGAGAALPSPASAPSGSANEQGGAAAAGAAAGAGNPGAAAPAERDPALDYPIKDDFGELSGYWVHRSRAEPYSPPPVQTWNMFSLASYDKFFGAGRTAPVAGGADPQQPARGSDTAAGAAQPSPAGLPTPPPVPAPANTEHRPAAYDIRVHGHSGKPDPRYRNPSDPPQDKGQSKSKSGKYKGKSSKEKESSWGSKGKSSYDDRGGHWGNYRQGGWHRGGW